MILEDEMKDLKTHMVLAVSIGYWVGVFVSVCLYVSIVVCYRRRKMIAKPIPV